MYAQTARRFASCATAILSLFAAGTLAQPASADLAQIQPYNPGTGVDYQIVGIYNAADYAAHGASAAPLRAATTPTDNAKIGPNVPLTFLVRVNNGDPNATQVDSVYLQFKDPDSRYQDINYTVGHGLEHKVFTRDYTDFSFDPNDALGSTLLFNGTEGETSKSFTGKNGQQIFGLYPNTSEGFQDIFRGAIAGNDAKSFISLGHVDTANQNTINPVVVTDGNYTHHLPGIATLLPGYHNTEVVSGDPGKLTYSYSLTSGQYQINEQSYKVWGQEYECQYIDAKGNTGGYPGSADAASSDYGRPYYLAGVDDQQNRISGPRSEWLHLQPVNNQPGLFRGTWAPPRSPSDYYIDVIVSNSNLNQWRIYDNVWGFSTLPFAYDTTSPGVYSANPNYKDILVVNDNALGQKFAANQNIANLRPTFYGAESYYTDIDEDIIPNATEYWTQVTGRKPFLQAYDSNGMRYPARDGNGSPIVTNGVPQYANVLADDTIPVEIIQPFAGGFPGASQTTGQGVVWNGLGVHSYSDNNVDIDGNGVISRDENLIDAPESHRIPKSNAYSIWRILCRGAVTPAVYTAYSPRVVHQPAVNDPSSGLQAAAQDIVHAERCIVWISPFTGDLPFNNPASLNDTDVQNNLKDFVGAGGRLFVSGQDVGSALTFENAQPSGPKTFLYDVLGASLKDTGSNNAFEYQTLIGSTGIGNRISFDSYINFLGIHQADGAYSNFIEYAPLGEGSNPFSFVYKAPGDDSPIYLGNNYIQSPPNVNRWRTDGALTQIGPYPVDIGTSQVQGQIDSLIPRTTTPMANASDSTVNFTNNGDAQGNKGAELVYYSNYNPGKGYGSRVVYAAFGLEGLGVELYRKTFNNTDYFYPRNVRVQVLHNIVSYLRSAKIVGKVSQATGSQLPVSGATVYALPWRSPKTPGPRQVFSTLTDSQGNYEIDGVEPGVYRIIVYRTGFNRNQTLQYQVANSEYTVAGDTKATVNLQLTALPSGTISGDVYAKDGSTLVAGASVIFKDNNGNVLASTSTDDKGHYSVTLIAGTYIGSASKAGKTSDFVNVTVTSGQVTTNNFTINTDVGRILTGKVVDENGNGLGGATVSFTSNNYYKTATTVNDGTYTSPLLPAGSYTVKASQSGRVPTNGPDTAAAVVGQQTAVTPDLILSPSASSITVQGAVTTTVKTQGALPAISGATVTFTDASGTVVGTATTTAALDTDGNNYTLSPAIAAGVYTVTVSATGYTPVIKHDVSLTTSPATLKFQLSPTGSGHTFKGKAWQFFSIPYEMPGETFDTVFDPTSTGNRSPVFVYDPSIPGYIKNPNPPADGFYPGQGYWVYLYKNDVTFTPNGRSLPAGPYVSVQLKSGWNMIGVPSVVPINVSDIKVGAGSPAQSFDAAVGAGTLKGTLYTYQPGADHYDTVTSSGTLQPYQAYWIKANAGVTIQIPTSTYAP